MGIMPNDPMVNGGFFQVILRFEDLVWRIVVLLVPTTWLSIKMNEIIKLKKALYVDHLHIFLRPNQLK